MSVLFISSVNIRTYEPMQYVNCAGQELCQRWIYNYCKCASKPRISLLSSRFISFVRVTQRRMTGFWTFPWRDWGKPWKHVRGGDLLAKIWVRDLPEYYKVLITTTHEYLDENSRFSFSSRRFGTDPNLEVKTPRCLWGFSHSRILSMETANLLFEIKKILTTSLPRIWTFIIFH